jgi:hypothetical protein
LIKIRLMIKAKLTDSFRTIKEPGEYSRNYLQTTKPELSAMRRTSIAEDNILVKTKNPLLNKPEYLILSSKPLKNLSISGLLVQPPLLP